MKKFLKNNIEFIFGLIIGIIITGTCVYASNIFAANQVSYDNSNVAIQKNDVNVTNVQDAIETLYEKALVCENGGSGEEPETSTGCPGEGCYYSWNTSLWYTTWNTESQTPKTINPNSLESGVSTNYNDVVQGNTFIAMKLNSNNQVEHAYACGVKNNTPFCIEGTYNDNPNKTTIQTNNLAILTPVFGSCSGAVGSVISCGEGGSLNAGSHSSGAVAVSWAQWYCGSDITGYFRCYSGGSN